MQTESLDSLFDRSKGATRLLDVPMGGISFVDFKTTPAIGTNGLGSCSVVAITSEKGAILAHIPPRPESAALYDPDAGDSNVRVMMQDIRGMYDRGISYGYFFAGSASHVVCAVLKGQTALPHQVDIMENTLRDMGLGPTTYTYNVPVDRRVLGHGTVVVITSTRPATMPSVHVENRVVTDPSAAHTEAELIEFLRTNDTSGPTPNVDLALTPNFAEHGARAYYFPEHQSMATNTTWMHGDSTGSMAAETIWIHGDATSQSLSHTQPKAAGGVAEIGDVQNDPASNRTDMAMSSPTPASSTSTTTWVKVDVRLQPHTFSSDEYIFRDDRGRSITTKKGDWRRTKYNGQDVSEYRRGRTRYYKHKRIG